MWQSSSSNSTMFKLWTFSTDSKFDECFKRFVVECEFVEKSLLYDWFHMHREPGSASNLFFLKFNLSHKLQLLNVQHNFCSVMCHTVLIWALILLILGNRSKILLQSFNWPKLVHQWFCSYPWCLVFFQLAYFAFHILSFDSISRSTSPGNLIVTSGACLIYLVNTVEKLFRILHIF